MHILIKEDLCDKRRCNKIQNFLILELRNGGAVKTQSCAMLSAAC